MADLGIPPHQPRRAEPQSPQLLFGLLIIAVGLLFTLDNFGLVDARHYLRYWPLGLIAIGGLKLWNARGGRDSSFGALLITAIGVWLILENTIDIRISFGDMWPLLLVFLGGYLVWRGAAGTERVASADDRSVVSALAILSGVNRGNNSRTFRGGNLTAVMGGCEIDLRQAAINGDAVLEVFAMWGGIEVRVPDDWTVTLEVTPLMGGAEDKTRPPIGTSVHRLTVRGMVLMGGVEIKN